DPGLELLDRILAAALAEDRQRVVDDLLGHRLLAVEHDLVDHLLDEAIAVDGVRLDPPGLGCCTTRHRKALLGLDAVLRAGLLAILARFQTGRSELLLGSGATLADQLAGCRHAMGRVAGAIRRANDARRAVAASSRSPHERPTRGGR